MSAQLAAPHGGRHAAFMMARRIDGIALVTH